MISYFVQRLGIVVEFVNPRRLPSGNEF
jgi:hypothetical protein